MQIKNAIAIVHAMASMCGMHKSYVCYYTYGEVEHTLHIEYYHLLLVGMWRACNSSIRRAFGHRNLLSVSSCSGWHACGINVLLNWNWCFVSANFGVMINPLTTIVQKSILPLRDRNRAYMHGFQRIRLKVFLINIKF